MANDTLKEELQESTLQYKNLKEIEFWLKTDCLHNQLRFHNSIKF